MANYIQAIDGQHTSDDSAVANTAADFKPAIFMNDEELIAKLLGIIMDSDWDCLVSIAENITGRTIDYDVDKDGAWMYLDPELDKVEDYKEVHQVAWSYKHQKYIDGGIHAVKI